MQGKIQVRLAVLVALAALAALLASTATASADPEKNFLVEVAPAVAVDDSTQAFDFTFTNVDANNPLGGIEIDPATAVLSGEPVFFTLSAVGDPSLGTWSVTNDGTTVQLLANDSAARLTFGQSISITVTYDIPDINVDLNDIDLIYTFPVEGRQANNFNSEGNVFIPTTETREQLAFRDGDGLEPVSLQSNQVLVVSGEVYECTGDCFGSDTQTGITVDVTIEGCASGTLVVDATDLFAGQSDIISGFYNYLPVEETQSCYDPAVLKSALIEFTIPGEVARALNVKAKDITAAAHYGVDLADFYDPAVHPEIDAYVGDGQTLPACDDSTAVNCFIPASNGPNGIEAGVVLVFIPTDPGGVLFR
jgi:hypothetical protein